LDTVPLTFYQLAGQYPISPMIRKVFLFSFKQVIWKRGLELRSYLAVNVLRDPGALPDAPVNPPQVLSQPMILESINVLPAVLGKSLHPYGIVYGILGIEKLEESLRHVVRVE